jgi:hypothetical protein
VGKPWAAGLFSGLRNSSGSDRGIRLSEILFEKIELLTPRLDGSDQLPAIHHYADRVSDDLESRQ